MLLFFGIVFTVYGLINFYIIKRILPFVPAQYKNIFLVVIIFVVVSFVAARVIENVWISPVTIALTWIGSFWLAIMLYTFMFLVIIDFVRIINHFTHFFPSFLTSNPEKTKRITALIVFILVVITTAGGHLNTKIIAPKKFVLNIKKSAGNIKTLNVALATDLHLGTIYSYRFMYNVSELLNGFNPDVILLAGDIIDEDLGPVIKYDVGEHLKRLKAKYGVFAITGNHEYIGGVEPAVKYLESHGINLIRDNALLIDSSFYLVGREDRAKKQFSGKARKELSEIMKDVNKALPIIMMDHQPFNLEQARQNDVDLQVSGHTHNGQLWPFNYIVKKVYELAWGYKLIGNTHYYVSCGAGGWGPPVRTGSHPEVINIILNFVGEDNEKQ